MSDSVSYSDLVTKLFSLVYAMVHVEKRTRRAPRRQGGRRRARGFFKVLGARAGTERVTATQAMLALAHLMMHDGEGALLPPFVLNAKDADLIREGAALTMRRAPSTSRGRTTMARSATRSK